MRYKKEALVLSDYKFDLSHLGRYSPLRPEKETLKVNMVFICEMMKVKPVKLSQNKFILLFMASRRTLPKNH